MRLTNRLVDQESGEVIYAVVPLPRRRAIGGFFMAIQEGFLHLSKLPLTGETRKVLEYLMSQLDFENWIRLSQTEVAAELQLQRQNVGRAIAELVRHGVIHPGPRVGQVGTYRLDPSFGWRGRESSRRKALRAIQGGLGATDRT